MTKHLNSNLRWLRKQKGLKQDEMQSEIGFTRTTWSNYENDLSKPDIEELNSISSYFGVSLDDIMNKDLAAESNLTHQKDSFKQDQHITVTGEPDPEFDKKNRVIPITDLSAAAHAERYASGDIGNGEAIRLPVDFLKKNAMYLTVRIKGDSMAPTLQDGGYAIIRLLYSSEWAKMQDDHIYAISDTEGKVYLKRVKNRFKKNFIVLTSDSTDKAGNPDFNLTTEEISTIWYMEWYLSAKMPNIHDQYFSRLQKVEDQVDDLVRKLKQISPK